MRASSKSFRLLSAFEGMASGKELGEAVQRLSGQLAKPERLRSALEMAKASCATAATATATSSSSTTTTTSSSSTTAAASTPTRSWSHH